LRGCLRVCVRVHVRVRVVIIEEDCLFEDQVTMI